MSALEIVLTLIALVYLPGMASACIASYRLGHTRGCQDMYDLMTSGRLRDGSSERRG